MKNDNKMLIHLKFQKNFVAKVQEEMRDEFAVASRKWGLDLNTDSEDLIYKHSLNQLRRKISEMARVNWDLGDQLTIKVNTYKKTAEVFLPSARGNASKLRLLYTRDGWERDQEITEGAIPVSEFLGHIEDQIITYARTAVFYGVGSYSD